MIRPIRATNNGQVPARKPELGSLGSNQRSISEPRGNNLKKLYVVNRAFCNFLIGDDLRHNMLRIKVVDLELKL